MAKNEKALGILALAAVIAYALACRPSWSPDSSQVAFPFAQSGDEETWGVAIYDVKLNQCTRVFDAGKAGGIQVVWLPPGESLVALVFRKKRAEEGIEQWDVIRISPKNGSHETVKSVVTVDVPVNPTMPAVVSEGRYLWLTSEKEGVQEKTPGLLKLDTVTGETKFVQTPISVYLSQNGSACVYLGMDEEEKVLRVGRLDPVAGALHEVCSLTRDALGGEPTASVAVNHDGSRLVLATHKEKCVRLVLLDGQGKKLNTIQCPDTILEPAYLTWGQDSRTVWLSAKVRTEEGAELVGVAEVNIESGDLRLHPIEGTDGGNASMVQPSLSPDKKWLALVPFTEKETGGLLLFDLTTPERKMTKVPIPPPKEQTKDAGKAKGKE